MGFVPPKLWRPTGINISTSGVNIFFVAGMLTITLFLQIIGLIFMCESDQLVVTDTVGQSLEVTVSLHFFCKPVSDFRRCWAFPVAFSLAFFYFTSRLVI